MSRRTRPTLTALYVSALKLHVAGQTDEALQRVREVAEIAYERRTGFNPYKADFRDFRAAHPDFRDYNVLAKEFSAKRRKLLRSRAK